MNESISVNEVITLGTLPSSEQGFNMIEFYAHCIDLSDNSDVWKYVTISSGQIKLQTNGMAGHFKLNLSQLPLFK